MFTLNTVCTCTPYYCTSCVFLYVTQVILSYTYIVTPPMFFVGESGLNTCINTSYMFLSKVVTILNRLTEGGERRIDHSIDTHPLSVSFPTYHQPLSTETPAQTFIISFLSLGVGRWLFKYHYILHIHCRTAWSSRPLNRWARRPRREVKMTKKNRKNAGTFHKPRENDGETINNLTLSLSNYCSTGLF